MALKNEQKRNILMSQRVRDEKRSVADYALKDLVEALKLAEVNALNKQEKMIEKGETNILELLKTRLRERGFAKAIAGGRAGEVTELGFLTGSSRRTVQRIENYDFIFKLIFDYAAPYILCGGALGEGKTDFALYSVEKGVEYQEIEEFAGNIKSVDPGNIEADYTYIKSWDELDDWLERNRKPKIFIHDEATQNLDKRRGMDKLILKYSHKGELFRKFNAHAILTCPDPYELDKRLTENRLTNCLFEKTDEKKVKIEAVRNKRLERSLPKNPIFYRDVPQTLIDFDTYEVAEFEYSDEEKEDEEKKTKDRKTDQVDRLLIMNAKNDLGLSQNKIALTIGVDQALVSRRKQKLKMEGKLDDD